MKLPPSLLGKIAQAAAPVLSPERQALADAIAASRERREAIAAASSALSKAEDAALVAKQAVYAAQGVLDEAPAATTRHMIAQASGQPSDRPATPREAREALADAKEHSLATQNVRDALAAELTSLQSGTSLTESILSFAAATVLRNDPAVAAFVAQVGQLQAELAVKGAVLLWLADNKVLDMDNVAVASHKYDFSPAAQAIHRLNSPPVWWRGIAPDPAFKARWETALAALRVDARATVPSAA